MISLKLTQSMAVAIQPFLTDGVYVDISLFIGMKAVGNYKHYLLRFSRSNSTPTDVFDDGICMSRLAASYFRGVLVKTCVIVSSKDRSRLRDTTRRALWKRVRELDVWLDSNGVGAPVVDRLAYADQGESPRRRGRKSQ